MNRAFSLLAIAGLLIVFIQALTAQDEHVAGKLFYGELFGPGVVTSVNFDSRFKFQERVGLGYRIGVGYGFEEFDDRIIEILFKGVDIKDFHKGVTKTFYSIPVGLNYVFGKSNIASTFEVGAGITLLTSKVSLYYWEMEKPGHVIGFINFMYRLAPVQGGMSFRVGFTPVIGTAGDLFPMFSIGFGYAF